MFLVREILLVILYLAFLIIVSGTPLPDGYIYNQDGYGFSGIIKSNPLSLNVKMTGYTDLYPGFVANRFAYVGAVFADEAIWLMPYAASNVLKIFVANASMVEYKDWPFPKSVHFGDFYGGVYDGRHSIWMVPFRGQYIMKLSTITGEMKNYTNWPTGYTPPTGFKLAFEGGVFDRLSSSVFLVPRDCDQVVRIFTVNETMVGFKDWPPGFVKDLSAFAGGVLDEMSNLWLVPLNADSVIKLSISHNGTMVGFKNWPSTFTKEKLAFAGGTCDGEFVWLVPSKADHVIKISSSTGLMEGFNNWPGGYTAEQNSAFRGGVFDGEGIWMVPYSSNILIKILVSSGEMRSYDNWPTGFVKGVAAFSGGVFDGESVWLVPDNADRVVKISSRVPTLPPEMIYNQDGFGFNGIMKRNPLPENVRMTAFSKWPAGFVKGYAGFIGGVYDPPSEALFLIPFIAKAVVKIFKTNGSMVQYTNWPVGFNKSALAKGDFMGAVSDGNGTLWFIPSAADQLIAMNMSNGEMVSYKDWPPGYSFTPFAGGVFDGRDAVWLVTGNGDMVVKVFIHNGTMVGYQNWPPGFIGKPFAFEGAVFDGDGVWMVPRNADRVVMLSTSTGLMSGFNNWPSNFSKGNNAFSGGTFDGEFVWLIPYNADRFIKISISTGEMVGYKDWPSGYVISDTRPFHSAVFDGEALFMVPYNSMTVLKVFKSNGTMVQYPWPEGVSTGKGGFWGGAFDGESVWLVPCYANYVVKISGALPENKMYNQDGFGFSGIIKRNPLPIIGGINMTGYSNWPSGFTKQNAAFLGGVFDPVHKAIWLVPEKADAVVRVSVVNGSMVRYDNWPVGFGKTTSKRFSGCISDGEAIWMVPNFDKGAYPLVIKIHMSSGDMASYNNWPPGFILPVGGSAFSGGVYDGTYVWLVPGNSDMVIKIAKSDGAMVGYSDWPAGYIPTNSAFSGGVFDGEAIWLVPRQSSMLVKIFIVDGTMQGYRNWPAGFVASGGFLFCGGIFDGLSVWLIPYWADSLLQISVATGTMKAYNSWPRDFVKTRSSSGFCGGGFDGESLWMAPFSAQQLIKFSTSSGAMIAYNNWPGGKDSVTASNENFVGGVFDREAVWLLPSNADRIVKISSKRELIYSQDGFGFGGIVKRNPLPPVVNMTKYEDWPASGIFRNSNNVSNFMAAVYDNVHEAIWLIPNCADAVVKVSKQNGSMIAYQNWPTGISIPVYFAFQGAAFDGKNVWLAPKNANGIVKIDTNSSPEKAMIGYKNWPVGFVKVNNAFDGAIFDGEEYVWMLPHDADRLIVISTLNGSMFGYNHWPVGVIANIGKQAFAGGVYDSEAIWLVPYNAAQVVKVIVRNNATMVSYENWPVDFRKGNRSFAGGTFDGEFVWLVPMDATHLIKLSSLTGAMIGYNRWPMGKKSSGVFMGALFDGQSIWLVPYSAEILVRIDKANGTMVGYQNWPVGVQAIDRFVGGVFDGESIWLTPTTFPGHVVKVWGERTPLNADRSRTVSPQQPTQTRQEIIVAPGQATSTKTLTENADHQSTTLQTTRTSLVDVTEEGTQTETPIFAQENTSLSLSISSMFPNATSGDQPLATSSSIAPANNVTQFPAPPEDPIAAKITIAEVAVVTASTTSVVVVDSFTSSVLESGGGGGSNEMQAIVVLGLMGCSRPGMKKLTKDSKRAVTPLEVGSTSLAGIYGHLIILGGILTVHCLVILIWTALRKQPIEKSSLDFKFPSLSFSVMMMMYQGLTFEASILTFDPKESASVRAVAGIVLAMSGGVPMLGAWWVKTKCDVSFTNYRHVFQKHSTFMKRCVLPSGYWGKGNTKKRQLGFMFSSFPGVKRWWMFLIPFCQAFVISGLAGIFGSSHCSIQAGILTFLFLCTALAIFLLQPYRLRWSNSCKGVVNMMTGLMAASGFYTPLETILSGILLTISAVSVGYTVTRLLLGWREKAWFKREVQEIGNAQAMLAVSGNEEGREGATTEDGKSSLVIPLLEVPRGQKDEETGALVNPLDQATASK